MPQHHSWVRITIIALGLSLSNCDKEGENGSAEPPVRKYCAELYQQGKIDSSYFIGSAAFHNDSAVCQAAFESWFIDPQSGSCRKQGYSGCELKGFQRQAECEACIGSN